MSELKPCEAIEILENGDWWNWLSQEFDPESEPSTDLHSALDAAISANRRAQPVNEPLVQCKECKRFDQEERAFDSCDGICTMTRYAMHGDDFCSYGVRPPERNENSDE